MSEAQNLDNLRNFELAKHLEDTDNETSKFKQIAEHNGIDNTKDAFGKTLLLQSILESMSDKEANEFMTDTLSMLEDEVEAYEFEAKPTFDLGHIFGDIHKELDGIADITVVA